MDLKKGKYQKQTSGSKKVLVLVLSLVLLLGLTVGGTVAWLTATSEPIKNTFTTSNIGVELKETTTSYVMIPGHDIAKDPKAAVTAGSEAAWLFVKLDKSANFDQYMTYEMAEGWTEVENGVYARKVVTADIGTAYSVLKGDKVTVKDTVTKGMMNDLTEATYPTLTITAYASQLMKNADTEFTAAEAWANVKPST